MNGQNQQTTERMVAYTLSRVPPPSYPIPAAFSKKIYITLMSERGASSFIQVLHGAVVQAILGCLQAHTFERMLFSCYESACVRAESCFCLMLAQC